LTAVVVTSPARTTGVEPTAAAAAACPAFYVHLDDEIEFHVGWQQRVLSMPLNYRHRPTFNHDALE